MTKQPHDPRRKNVDGKPSDGADHKTSCNSRKPSTTTAVPTGQDRAQTGIRCDYPQACGQALAGHSAEPGWQDAGAGDAYPTPHDWSVVLQDIVLPEPDAHLDDDVWLAGLAECTGIPQTGRFVLDALLARRLRPLIRAIEFELEDARRELDAQGESEGRHPFLLLAGSLVDAAETAFWRVCSECAARGRCPAHPRRGCPVCQGSGYEFS